MRFSTIPSFPIKSAPLYARFTRSYRCCLELGKILFSSFHSTWVPNPYSLKGMKPCSSIKISLQRREVVWPYIPRVSALKYVSHSITNKIAGDSVFLAGVISIPSSVGARTLSRILFFFSFHYGIQVIVLPHASKQFIIVRCFILHNQMPSFLHLKVFVPIMM